MRSFAGKDHLFACPLPHSHIIALDRYETASKAELSIVDWDELSSNDHIGYTSFNVADLMSALQRDKHRWHLGGLDR